MRKASSGASRILLVEDSPDNQKLIGIYLKAAGYQFDIADNGKAGVEKAMANHYDVVLMDIQMPVMDGHAAVRMMRSNGYQGPIIALTAHAMTEERARAKVSGFTDYLTKPLEREKLLASIGNLISHKL